MPDSIVEFFEQLAEHGHETVLEGVDGSIRYDIESEGRTDYWYVEIKDGDVHVVREARPAECVVRVPRSAFARLVAGEATAQVLWLRGLLLAEGKIVMNRLFDRLFPGPPGAHDPRDFVKQSGRPQ